MGVVVDTGIEVIRSDCHRSTWIVANREDCDWCWPKAGPFNVAKRAAELITERPDALFEWVQLHADAWVLHIVEPDG